MVGTGKCKLLLPTPQIIAEESTSLYGISPDNNSHTTTPNDLQNKYQIILTDTIELANEYL